MKSELRKRSQKSNDKGEDEKEETAELLHLKSDNVPRPIHKKGMDKVFHSKNTPRSASSADKNKYEISSGTYWITRILYLRYLAFIYCK